MAGINGNDTLKTLPKMNLGQWVMLFFLLATTFASVGNWIQRTESIGEGAITKLEVQSLYTSKVDYEREHIALVARVDELQKSLNAIATDTAEIKGILKSRQP